MFGTGHVLPPLQWDSTPAETFLSLASQFAASRHSSGTACGGRGDLEKDQGGSRGVEEEGMFPDKAETLAAALCRTRR